MTTETSQTFKTLEDRHLGSNGLRIEKLFTKKLNHPYSDIEWQAQEIAGKTIITPQNWPAETVNSWSQALYPENVPQIDIKGVEINEKGREVLGSENSFRQLFDRVASSFRWWGESFGYFHRKIDAQNFEDEIKYAISHHLVEFDMSHLKWAGLKYAYNLKAENSEGWYLDQDSNEIKSVKEKFSRPFLFQTLILDVSNTNLVELITTNTTKGVEVVVDFRNSTDQDVLKSLPAETKVQISATQSDLISQFPQLKWQVVLTDISQLTALQQLSLAAEVTNISLQFNPFEYILNNIAIPEAKIRLEGLNPALQAHLTRLVTVALDISTIMGKFPAPEIAANSAKYHTIGIESDQRNIPEVRLEMLATSAELAKNMSALPKQESRQRQLAEFVGETADQSFTNYIIQKYPQRLQALVRSTQSLVIYSNELTELSQMIDLNCSQINLTIQPVEIETPAIAAVISTPEQKLQPTLVKQVEVTTPATIKNLNSLTHKFEIARQSGFLTLVTNDSHIKEIIIFMPRQNAAFNEMLNAICTGINLALKAGVDLQNIISTYQGMQFEPQGATTNAAIPQVKSVIDYAMQFLSQVSA